MKLILLFADLNIVEEDTLNLLLEVCVEHVVATLINIKIDLDFLKVIEQVHQILKVHYLLRSSIALFFWFIESLPPQKYDLLEEAPEADEPTPHQHVLLQLVDADLSALRLLVFFSSFAPIFSFLGQDLRSQTCFPVVHFIILFLLLKIENNLE